MRRSPDAIAVIFGEEHVAYDELNRRANRLAAHLIDLGVGPDAIVGVCTERSVEMIVGVVAALKAGAGYAPLDPALPRERFSYLLANCQMGVLLTKTNLVAGLAGFEGGVVRLDEDWGASCTEHPTSAVTTENLLYVLHTSGSTGKPKGVAMPHRPLSVLMDWQRARSGEMNGQRTLQFATLNFDVSCQEIFSTLSTGGALVLIDETTQTDIAAIGRLINEQAVSRLFLPFVALRYLAETISTGGVPLR